MKFQDYLEKFNTIFSNLEYIDNDFYKAQIGVNSFVKKAKTRDVNNNFSEEYIRARFVYAMIFSGMYPKENICVEFSFPKGNTKGTLNPDVVIFKKEGWLTDFENKNYKNIRQNLLLIGETKKNTETVEKAVENQLRSAMQENSSEEKIFGLYFDNQQDILFFKKVGNSEVRRYDELKEQNNDLNYSNRDNLIDLPSFDDLIKNNESLLNVAKLKLDFLDAIDEGNLENYYPL